MKKTLKIITLLAIFATLLSLACGTTRAIKELQFDLNCTQYIELAIKTDDVETTKQYLSKAISYAEENNFTKGYVSIIHHYKNDIGYWYKNLTDAYAKLENISEDATFEEKEFILTNIKESLTEKTDTGICVITPNEIGLYPNNILYSCWDVLSNIAAIGLWIAHLVFRIKYWIATDLKSKKTGTTL